MNNRDPKKNSIPKRKKNESRCPVFSRCGSCEHIDVPYAEQLAKKKDILANLLSDFGRVEDMVGMDDPFHCRCKITRAFIQGKGGKVMAGNYAEGSKEIVPISDCLVEDSRAAGIINDICELLRSFKMKIYNSRTGYGNFRYVSLRIGKNTDEIMVILVTRSPIFPSKNNFVKALLKLHPEITTIVHNINDRTDSLVIGPRNNVLYGKGYIEDSLSGLTFRISPGSFYQVNPYMAEKIYERAVSFIPDGFNGVVLDAYCGTGTIGLIASRKGAEVIGVELSRDAVKDARTNKKINNVKNIEFFPGDAGEFLTKYYEDGGKAGIVIMDPPRQGSTPEFIDTLRKLSPEKLVYVSCNPITLKRDLLQLTEPRDHARGSYKVLSITGYDMFPFTENIETVCCLSKGDVKSKKIRVEFSLEDMDTDGFKQGATYNAIRDWIKAKYGYRVTNLNIAQVKQKHGIIERDNYNKPKSPDSKQPGCPEEKIKAIEDAMMYFWMI